MRIYVLTQTGLNYPLDVEASDTVEELKYRLYEEQGIPPETQKLVYLEKEMADDRTLVSYKVTPNTTLSLAFHSTTSFLESPHFMPSSENLGRVKRSWGMMRRIMQSVRDVDPRKFFKWRSCFTGDNVGSGRWNESDHLVAK